MTHQYESEVLNKLMERDGINIPSSVPPYEAEIKAYLINQVIPGYPKLTDYEAEWLVYNYTKHLPADFPISSVSNVTEASFENVVPIAYQSAILKGRTLINLVDVPPSTIAVASAFRFNAFTPKQNTEYTMFINLTSLNESKKLTIGSIDSNNKNATILNVDIFLGTNKIKFITLSDTKILRLVNNSSFGGGDVAFENVMILEGDYTNVDIPYFTGMQSVKMPVLTTTNEDGTKTIILTVNEDVTLRSNGGVYDELDLLTGKLTQRIDEDGEVLAKEVIKTVDLKTVNESGESIHFIPLEGTMSVSSSSETIQPTFDMSVSVEATTQNLATFINLEMEE